MTSNKTHWHAELVIDGVTVASCFGTNKDTVIQTIAGYLVQYTHEGWNITVRVQKEMGK